jgi:hypothetical protein
VKRAAFFAISLTLLTSSALAKPTMPDQTPADRIRRNLERTLKANPKDADAWLALARLDSQQFVYGEKQDPDLVLEEHGAVGDPARKTAAIAEFKKALDARPACAVCALGLGNILERGKDRDEDAALAAYRKAWSLSVDGDAKQTEIMPVANAEVSVEAGTAILGILEPRKSAADAKEIETIKQHIAAMQKKPHAVSPVIFGMAGARELSSLLAPGETASFDLDSMGGSRWPWIAPTTAVLVWDPHATGRIVDGRQLFGNVTWHLLFRSGYDALAALDDDGDGALSGAELAGIAVWRDANGNGVSDAGEVDSLDDLGIVRIAARNERVRDGVPANRSGIVFRDGWTVPSWDWTPSAIAPSAAGF